MARGKDPSAFYEVLKGSVGKPLEGEPGRISDTPATGRTVEAMPGVLPGKPTVAQRWIGENVVRISYNTAAFLVLVIVALFFIAFALGVKYGKSSAVAPVKPPVATGERSAAHSEGEPTGNTGQAVNETRKPPAPVAQPPDGKWWTIRLMDYANKSLEEKTKAHYNAKILETRLVEAGLDRSQVRIDPQAGGGASLVVYYGRLADPKSPETAAILRKIRDIKQRDGRALFPQAALEEIKENRR
ncbi:MAG: hypothetical protein A2Z34_06480 [Planctomycetes bacterium RBG_16_59_8]|nr:MAG: hypothetical protein A2Z34_06480 [Planctomycetes bacterium RBG_16_59_8]